MTVDVSLQIKVISDIFISEEYQFLEGILVALYMGITYIKEVILQISK